MYTSMILAKYQFLLKNPENMYTKMYTSESIQNCIHGK